MKITNIVYAMVFASIISSCARVGRPEGGPKDETAPIMVTANPPYETLEFKEKNIRIYFDEYITLKELTKQLVVSPPVKTPLIITPQGTPSKYISIKIMDTLKENTTYTINFGNAIRDNNEGNTLESFKYVFSTGTYIDSLKVKGAVKPAFRQKKFSNIGVLLYRYDRDFNDSIVYKKKPDYVSNTLDSTDFEFSNIREGKYLMIALKDKGNDYKFNPKVDQIGFLSDTLHLPQDSILAKEIVLFTEKQPFKLKRPKELFKGKIRFGFQGNKADFKARLLSQVPADFKAIAAFDEKRDTLNYWYTPNVKDSLQFAIEHRDFTDTVTVRLRKKKIDSLRVTSKIKRILNLKDTLILEANNPIVAIDTSKISLVDRDTLPVKYSIAQLRHTKLAVLFDKKPSNEYSFQMLPDALEDIYTCKTDTIKYQFGTLEPEDYGTIIFNVSNANNHQLLVELIDGDEVIDQRVINSTKTVNYTLLEPKDYLIRVIVDDNKNGRWDTGNYLKRQQPERVEYFQKILKLRANWVDNETMIIE
ncbi:Ig-like domain-containing protein [Tenacibaculum litopenaei]|uniref:Ig-like domain-containing protein n=1 Tax=Tenacibaculum litopenaei TaxID=396016 RepID=UPI0038B44F6A